MSHEQQKRERMVKEQIIARGIQDEAVIDAFLRVKRSLFVPPEYREYAYNDHPLSIGCDQTISQPYIVALMTEALELSKRDTVLEIGTGSGYQTAILALLSKHVYTIERFASLQKRAKKALKKCEIENVSFIAKNGYEGWEEHAPYDRIICTAAAPHVPEALASQLAESGLMVIPIGTSFFQKLYVYRKENGELSRRFLCDCAFVPMVDEG
ncbi:MAG: protein-L-isoaspartate(D-aspartate) O-methyltransferase [Acholeplasmataceae bacterium]